MQWTLNNQSKQEKIKTLESTITQLVNIANGRVEFINKNKELFDKKVKKLNELKVNNPSNVFLRQSDNDKVMAIIESFSNIKSKLINTILFLEEVENKFHVSLHNYKFLIDQIIYEFKQKEVNY